jgi:polyphosphate:AMP phosphotransferase
MFETAELGRKLSKQEFERALPRLRTDLLRVQNELNERADFSVIVVVAGVDGAGKGDTVNVLHEWMDPRFLEAHGFGPASDEERERPEMWRFWRVLPPKGRIGIFVGSWYTDPILQRVYGKTEDADLDRALGRIRFFERCLTADGTLLIKLWFHLAKDVQKKRLKKLSRDPEQSWRVTKRDWKHFKLYDRFVVQCEKVLQVTSTGDAPWTIIEGTDKRYRELTVGRHILDAVNRHARKIARRRTAKRHSSIKPSRTARTTILSTLDLSLQLEPKPYRKRLAAGQARMARLQRKAFRRGVSMVMVFEGWDAAGKGGAVRRITRALDARDYKVVPIAAPSDEERARHYLWRFWRRLPRAGQVTIFDRSWYGRVLVERVEGFASEQEWRRAYQEINAFEHQIRERGMALVKCWLHIGKDEQLRRFKARAKTSYKKYKLTPEDYRNRSKWSAYELAVNEMVERTSTAIAPWTLVEANDKRWARVKVLEASCDALAAALRDDKSNE